MDFEDIYRRQFPGVYRYLLALRAALPIRSERHIVIGNGLFTDFETGYFKVPREVDAVYYLAGDYDLLPSLGEEEFREAAADAALVWARGRYW